MHPAKLALLEVLIGVYGPCRVFCASNFYDYYANNASHVGSGHKGQVF